MQALKKRLNTSGRCSSTGHQLSSCADCLIVLGLHSLYETCDKPPMTNAAALLVSLSVYCDAARDAIQYGSDKWLK